MSKLFWMSPKLILDFYFSQGNAWITSAKKHRVIYFPTLAIDISKERSTMSSSWFDPSEHQIQSKLVYELTSRMRPSVVRMAIPNGGMRHPIVGKHMKAEGLMPGSPDLIFALEQGRVLWLEMKRAKGKLSDVQIGLHHRLRQIGHTVEVAFSFDEAMALLDKHGVLR